MGAVTSTLVGAAKNLRLAAGILGDLHRQYSALDTRLDAAPGLPRPSATSSFWLDDPPHPELVDAQSAALPATADVVILGSGITGVAVARSLLETAPASISVVVLEAERAVAQLKEWVPEFAIAVWPAEAAREKFKTGPHVVGALSYRAGALWPYRLVTSLWRRLLDAYPDRLAIETSTPATAVNTDPDPGYLLLAPLRRKLAGARAHMSAQRPGPGFPDDLDGARSWSVIYGSGFDYITQRRRADGGTLLAGGGFSRSAHDGLDQVAVYDDADGALDLFTVTHLHGILPAVFGPHYWGSGGGVERVWSGIVAPSADLLPLVGRLDPRLTGRPTPDKTQKNKKKNETATADPGEWIAAAYSGDGMVCAWLCGTAVGLMVAGREKEDLPAAPGRPGGRVADWLPAETLATYNRLKTVDIADLADMVM